MGTGAVSVLWPVLIFLVPHRHLNYQRLVSQKQLTFFPHNRCIATASQTPVNTPILGGGNVIRRTQIIRTQPLRYTVCVVCSHAPSNTQLVLKSVREPLITTTNSPREKANQCFQGEAWTLGAGMQLFVCMASQPLDIIVFFSHLISVMGDPLLLSLSAPFLSLSRHLTPFDIGVCCPVGQFFFFDNSWCHIGT